MEPLDKPRLADDLLAVRVKEALVARLQPPRAWCIGLLAVLTPSGPRTERIVTPRRQWLEKKLLLPEPKLWASESLAPDPRSEQLKRLLDAHVQPPFAHRVVLLVALVAIATPVVRLAVRLRVDVNELQTRPEQHRLVRLLLAWSGRRLRDRRECLLAVVPHPRREARLRPEGKRYQLPQPDVPLVVAQPRWPTLWLVLGPLLALPIRWQPVLLLLVLALPAVLARRVHRQSERLCLALPPVLAALLLTRLPDALVVLMGHRPRRFIKSTHHVRLAQVALVTPLLLLARSCVLVLAEQDRLVELPREVPVERPPRAVLKKRETLRLVHLLLAMLPLAAVLIALKDRLRQPSPQDLDATLLVPVLLRAPTPPLARARALGPGQLPQDAVPPPVARHPLQPFAHRVDLPRQLLVLGALMRPRRQSTGWHPLRLVVVLLITIAGPVGLVGAGVARGRPSAGQLVNRSPVQRLRTGVKPLVHLPRALRARLRALQAVLLVLLVTAVVLAFQQPMQRFAYTVLTRRAFRKRTLRERRK